MYILNNPTEEKLQEINNNLKDNRYSLEWNAPTSVSLQDIVKSGIYFDWRKFRQPLLKKLGADQTELSEAYLTLCQKNGYLPEAENIYLSVNDVVIAMRDIAEHYADQKLPKNINVLFNENTSYAISKKFLQYSYYNTASAENQQTKQAFENFVATLEKAYGSFINKDNLPHHTAYLNEVIARHQQREVSEYRLPE